MLIGVVILIGGRDIPIGLEKQSDLIKQIGAKGIASCNDEKVIALIHSILNNSNEAASSLINAMNILAVLFIGLGIINAFITHKYCGRH